MYLVQMLVEIFGLTACTPQLLLLGIPKLDVNPSFKAQVEFLSVYGNPGIKWGQVVLGSFGVNPEWNGKCGSGAHDIRL